MSRTNDPVYCSISFTRTLPSGSISPVSELKTASSAFTITLPDSICWLLNIRGGDVPHTPLPLSFAILRSDAAVILFIDRRKLVAGLERHLGNQVTVMPPEGLGPALDALAAEGDRVQVDPATAA